MSVIDLNYQHYNTFNPTQCSLEVNADLIQEIKRPIKKVLQLEQDITEIG